LPPPGPQAQGWTGKCKSSHGQCLAEEIDTAIAEAVKGLSAFGAEIGSRLGITRQAAQQRWGTS
jgi:hypothetical protein